MRATLILQICRFDTDAVYAFDLATSSQLASELGKSRVAHWRNFLFALFTMGAHEA